MLKKYLTKFVVDILPSVAATVIGAYIVNHYIVTKPAANAPVASAVSTVDPKAEAKGAAAPAKAEAKNEAKPREASSDIANIPEAGVRAKGISEKAVFDKSAVEKPAEKSAAKEKSADKDKSDKSADRPGETASIPVETRRQQPAPREKAIAKAVPHPAQPVVPAVVPVVAAPNPAPPVEAATAAEERRDANDLARAAIERLRGANDGSPRAQEASRVPDASRIPEAPRVVLAPGGRPLPSPIMVSTPPTAETVDANSGSSQMRPPYAAATRTDDPRRPTPPADIPLRPLDLRVEGTRLSGRDHTSVAEDMLSAAKSMFHSVLPR